MRMWVLWILLAIVILGMAGLWVSVRAELAAMRSAPALSDAIVVLGARVRADGSLSATLEYRLDKALALYRAGYARVIVVCGGRGEDEPMAEADAMAAYLIGHGVPESAVARESESRNTQENVRFAGEILRRLGCQTALVVTSDYHLARALHLAGDAGLSASGAGSHTPEPVYHWYMRAREVLGWIKHALLERP